MKRRVFIGIPISIQLSSIIYDFIKRDKVFLPSDARIIKPKNLHLTLVPPWYEENLDSFFLDFEKKIKSMQIQPFKIQFTKISPGPVKTNPRLIWIEGKPTPELLNLKSFVEGIIEKRDVEKREFIPHITIARFEGKNSCRFKEEKIKFEETINSFCIFESRLSPKGANYKVLKKFTISNYKAMR